MISDNEPEIPVVIQNLREGRICAKCAFTFPNGSALMIVKMQPPSTRIIKANEQVVVGLSICTNPDSAHFQSVMCITGSCENWTSKPDQKVVDVPASIQNRMKGK